MPVTECPTQCRCSCSFPVIPTPVIIPQGRTAPDIVASPEAHGVRAAVSKTFLLDGLEVEASIEVRPRKIEALEDVSQIAVAAASGEVPEYRHQPSWSRPPSRQGKGTSGAAAPRGSQGGRGNSEQRASRRG